jgi:hypothetical protein
MIKIPIRWICVCLLGYFIISIFIHNKENFIDSDFSFKEDVVNDISNLSQMFFHGFYLGFNSLSYIFNTGNIKTMESLKEIFFGYGVNITGLNNFINKTFF